MPRAGTAARTALAAVSLVACAWFAVGIRQARDTDRAMAIIDQGDFATAAGASQARSLLAGAELLNPDREVQILLGRIAIERQDWRPAIQILSAVTRAEPQDLLAWVWLAHGSGSVPAIFFDALRHVRALDPAVPSSG